MRTFQCTHCHAIWSERSIPSLCPNCAKSCDQSVSDEISLTLSLLYHNEQWKTCLSGHGKIVESIWDHPPTNQELGEWLSTIPDPLWSE
jgi:hypothetical protein